MTDDDRLKAFAAMVDIDRKWVSVFDAKAGLISALNTLLLGFIWTSAKLVETHGAVATSAYAATGLCVVSLWMALRVVLPRGGLRQALGTATRYAEGFKAVSFYGFVSNAYGPKEEERFCKDMLSMTEKDLVREAIEQHFTISHVVQKKSNGVAISGWLWLGAVAMTIASVALRA